MSDNGGMRMCSNALILAIGVVMTGAVAVGQATPSTRPGSDLDWAKVFPATTLPAGGSHGEGSGGTAARRGAGTTTPATSVTPAAPTARSVDSVRLKATDRMQAARLQTMVARTGFSPGLIDGKLGAKTRTAIEAARSAGRLTEDDERALDSYTGLDDWTREYRVTASDLDWITGEIPTDWNERARLPKSGYARLTELLAERGWCSEDLVRALNPGVVLDDLRAGDGVRLPAVQDVPALPRLSRVEVDLGEKLVKGFDASGQMVSLMHCSIARVMEKRPVGTLSVTVVVDGPDYTFNPESWPEVKNVTRRLRIAPGPRNPVGAAWVGLDRPGYGMHGTVRPQDIGKTGSHGCFRLANWDALRLAKAVRIGTTVEVRE